MGKSQSTLGSQRRLKFPDNVQRVEYVKNFNNDGDSDYDDEDDSKIEDDASASELAPLSKDAIQKPSLHSKEGAKMFDDLKDEDEDESGRLLDVKQKKEGRMNKVFDDDNSVVQIDKQSSVASVKPSELIGDGSQPDSSSPRYGKKSKRSKSDEKKLDASKEPAPAEPLNRNPRTIMDPQQKIALDQDLERLK